MRVVPRYLVTQEAAILGLTLTAEICLPITVNRSEPDAWTSLFVITTILGVLCGFALFRSKSKASRVTVVTWLVGGAALLFVRTGELGAAIWTSTETTLRVLPSMLLSSEGTASNLQGLATWIGPQQQLISQVIAFTGRISMWFSALLLGPAYDDPAARAFCTSVGLWILAAWASWRIADKKDALGGLLPTTLALGLALNYIASNRWALWLHLAALLLLLAVLQLARLTRSWDTQQTDFSESVTIDSLTWATPAIILILSSAFVVSTFSIKDLVDRLRERQQQPPPSSIAGSRGKPTPGSHLTGPRPGADLLGTHQILAGPHLSRDIFMSVSTGELPPVEHAAEIQAPRYYWRRINYQNYTGSGWNNPTALEEPSPPQAKLVPDSPTDYRYVHATVRFPAGAESGIYWTGTLISSEQPLGVLWRAMPGSSPEHSDGDPFNDADMIGAFIAGSEAIPVGSYTFDAWLPQVSEAMLRTAPGTYPAWVTHKYLQLPETLPVRVRVLARELTASESTPYGRALAIERYLRQIPYSVEVPAPPPGRDATDFFLFSLRQGYCDYYATAMAVLARSVGLPARIVTGYASGDYDPYTAQYNVTQADAHTWTEIYFTGIGWIEFEPTASQPAPSREASHSQPHTSEGDTALEKLANALPIMNDSNIRLAWFILAGPLLVWLAWLAGDLWRLGRMDPAEATGRLYGRLRQSTRGLGDTGPIGQTALEYSASLADRFTQLGEGHVFARALLAPMPGMIARLTDMRMQELFAPTPLRAADRRQAILIWSRLRWRLAVLKMLLPISGLVDPRGRAPSTPPVARAG